MALQQLSYPIAYPYLSNHSAAPAVGASTTVATGQYHSIICVAHQAMTISHVGFRAATCTGSPTLDVRIETVDPATGFPSGTLWSTTTNIITGTLTTNSWNLNQLTLPTTTIAPGQVFAVKFAYNSGTSVVISSVMPSFQFNCGLPYLVVNTGAATKTAMNGTGLALGSSSTTFYTLPACFPAAAATPVNANAFNNTNSAAQGVRFQVPFNCRCCGIRTYQGTAAGGFNAVLYDDSGAELSSSSTAYDGDILLSTGTSNPSAFFDNPVTLSPLTWYRAALEPSSATNINMYTITLPSSDYLSAMPGGTSFMYATRSTGTWTDDNTKVALMDLLVDQLDDGIIAPTLTLMGGVAL